MPWAADGVLLGIGVDLADTRRVRALMARRGERFRQRVLHADEYPAHRRARDPARDLAKRWAVKEAVSKALGTGFRGIAARDIALLHAASGEPYVRFSARGAAVLARRGGNRVLVTMSDEGDMVVAMATVESVNPSAARGVAEE